MEQESLNRLEKMLPAQLNAAAKAVSESRIDLTPFGIGQQQVLNALEGRFDQLQSGVSAVALEAIVKLTGRPPLVVRNNKVEIELLDDFPAGTDVKIISVERFLLSVGRVEFINYSMAWGGTGWVVDKKNEDYLVLTNRHVAKLVAKRTADGRAVFLRSPITGVKYGAQIDFNEEVDAEAHAARVATAVDVEYVADDLAADMALLKVRKSGDGAWTMPDPIPLADKEAADKELIGLIGYPAYDSRNDVNAMEQYFRHLYDVKRFAPGRIIKTTQNSVLSHDCTSLGGNSGSVLLSLDQRKAVGLHFAGTYGVANSAVGVSTIKALLKGTLITVGGIAGSVMTEAVADGTHSAKDLAKRGGFNPAFLGKGVKATPWPELPKEIVSDLAKPSDATAARPHELRYTHFGVKYSLAYKLPVLTAVNVDGKNSVRIKRGNDKWFFDERIDKASQHGQRAYKDKEIDRGHMVRREDPNWGSIARQADGDTFHYTNSAPQHSRLNQGKQLWQGLENYILNSARTHGFKASVFTGPIFSDEDPILDEENIRVPLEFWKVVTMLAAGGKKLHATAYLLSQGQLIRKLLEDRNRSEAVEGFELGPYRTFQIAISDLESATGYDFGKLKNADPLARTTDGREAAHAGVPMIVTLERPQDLLL